jgi:hypothetical protein
MPRRRKSRHAQPNRNQVHQGPGYDGSREIGSRAVEDPYDPDNIIVVPANLRHDPLLRMFSRREIDEAQLKAGEVLRGSHEAIARHGLRAIDPSLDVVDGGRPPPGIPESAFRAGRRLREAQSLLGWQSYRLVVCVACEGLNGTVIAEKTSAKLDRNVVQFQLRSSLEHLAVLWGFVLDPKRMRRHASIVGMVRERAGWVHDETDLLIRYAPD